MKKMALAAFLAMSAAAMPLQAPTHPITMVFNDTDASFALMAVSMRTGANIVYANKNKAPITFKLSVNTAEEAVRAISAAAGLMYRRVGSVFVVAPSATMKDALAPYARTHSYLVSVGSADAIATKIQDALPFVTAHANGNRITVTGVEEDMPMVASIVDNAQAAQQAVLTSAEIVVLHHVAADSILPLLKVVYPTLQMSATESSKAPVGAAAPTGPTPAGSAAAGPIIDRWSAQNYGAIALVGATELVHQAMETIAKLDISPRGGGDNVVSRVYELKYMNGPSLEAFLRREAPEIDVFVGPESISPDRGTFNPLSSSQFSSSGAAGGGATGATGSTGAAGAAGGASGSTLAPAHPPTVGDRSKTIVLKGRQGDVDAALKLLTELDVKPRQVVVEVNVLETSPQDAEQIGLNYSYNPLSFFEVPAGTALTAQVAGQAPTLVNQATRPAGVGSISRSPISFNAVLSALVTHSRAKILAKPSMQVIDNDQASIFIGSTLRTLVSSAGPLGSQTQTVEEFPVGIILLISPRINADGSVLMHVSPVISAITSVDANNIPTTSAREADTTLIMKDGETIVMGGLIQDQDTRTVSEVPFLSQIPLIGELFKNRVTNHQRTDVVVSITTHVVKDTP